VEAGLGASAAHGGRRTKTGDVQLPVLSAAEVCSRGAGTDPGSAPGRAGVGAKPSAAPQARVSWLLLQGRTFSDPPNSSCLPEHQSWCKVFVGIFPCRGEEGVLGRSAPLHPTPPGFHLVAVEQEDGMKSAPRWAQKKICGNFGDTFPSKS